MRNKCTHHGCLHAQGDVCNCSCGGKRHGKANVINVTLRSNAGYSIRRTKNHNVSKRRNETVADIDIVEIVRSAFMRTFK